MKFDPCESFAYEEDLKDPLKSFRDKFYIPKSLHAIDRQKKLLAKALGYETDMSLIDYGILKEKFSNTTIN